MGVPSQGPTGRGRAQRKSEGWLPSTNQRQVGQGTRVDPAEEGQRKSTEFAGHSFMNVKKGIPASYTQCGSRRGGNARPGPPALLPPI